MSHYGIFGRLQADSFLLTGTIKRKITEYTSVYAPVSCTFTDSTNRVNATSHGLTDPTPIVFTATNLKGASCTFTASTNYVTTASAHTLSGSDIVYFTTISNDVTASVNSGTDEVNKTAHGLAANTPIYFRSAPGSSGISPETTVYYVDFTGVATPADYFKITTSPGGVGPVDILVTGAAVYYSRAISLNPFPYYVLVVDATNFQVSLTSGGAAIDITIDGTGDYYVNTVDFTAGVFTGVLKYARNVNTNDFQISNTPTGAIRNLVFNGSGTYVRLTAPSPYAIVDGDDVIVCTGTNLVVTLPLIATIGNGAQYTIVNNNTSYWPAEYFVTINRSGTTDTIDNAARTSISLSPLASVTLVAYTDGVTADRWEIV